MTFGREMLGATKRETPNRHKDLFHFTYDQREYISRLAGVPQNE